MTAVVAIVLPFCCFPSFYAGGSPRALADRAWHDCGRLPGLPGRHDRALAGADRLFWAPWRSVAVAVLMIVPLGLAATTLPDRALAAQYAMGCRGRGDSRREHLGVRTLVVPPLPRNLGEGFVTTDPKHFFNVCVARYYGLDSIAATADS